MGAAFIAALDLHAMVAVGMSDEIWRKHALIKIDLNNPPGFAY